VLSTSKDSRVTSPASSRSRWRRKREQPPAKLLGIRPKPQRLRRMAIPKPTDGGAASWESMHAIIQPSLKQTTTVKTSRQTRQGLKPTSTHKTQSDSGVHSMPPRKAGQRSHLRVRLRLEAFPCSVDAGPHTSHSSNRMSCRGSCRIYPDRSVSGNRTRSTRPAKASLSGGSTNPSARRAQPGRASRRLSPPVE